jgi:hypothetical protein
VSDAFAWLALLCVFLACMLVPACIFEYVSRSDYRAYLKHLKARDAWRSRVVGLDLKEGE